MDQPTAARGKDRRKWYACYTRGRHEKRVGQRLEQQGLEVFLPTVPRIRTWHDRRQVVEFPLFPSYVFARCAESELGVAVATPGLVQIVKFDGRPVPVPDAEIANLRRLAGGLEPREGAPELAPLIAEGQKVEIVSGPLSSVRGIVAETRGSKRVLVVGVAAIRQGLRVEVDRTALRPLPA